MEQLKKIILYAAFVLFALHVNAQRQLIDKVVAVVGDNIILQSDIEAQYAQMVTQSQGQPFRPMPSAVFLITCCWISSFWPRP